MATALANSYVSETTSHPDNLALLFQEMFTVVVRLRANRQRLGDVEVFRMQIRNTLKSIEIEALRHRYEMEDLRVATFAVVAFLDESILRSQNPFFADWSTQPLQLELFGVQAAGEIFHRNLERLFLRPDSTHAADLLEIHQLCLLMGFRGRYTQPQERNIALQRIESKMQRIRGAAPTAAWRPGPQSQGVFGPPRNSMKDLLRTVGQPILAANPLRRQKPETNNETFADIDAHFETASARLRESKGLKHLSSLPAVFLLGGDGEAKTSLIVKAGIQANLLAGQSLPAAVPIPTRTLNLWHGWDTLFVDPAGALLSNDAARAKLFRKFAPLPSVPLLFNAKAAPARSAICTVDCGIFFEQGGAEKLAAKANHFQTMLSELAGEIGSSFPVYVVFTKADQIPYFQGFVKNFNEGEGAEALGVTLLQGQSASSAFENLYGFLSRERKTQLARESDDSRLPDIYEFPREFAKLRPLLVHFLATLGYPRGFYFTGVRRTAEKGLADAPQWLFIKRLFSEVILAQPRPTPAVAPRAMAAAAG